MVRQSQAQHAAIFERSLKGKEIYAEKHQVTLESGVENSIFSAR